MGSSWDWGLSKGSVFGVEWRVVGTDNKLVVAVTDGDWFDVLRKRPELRKINFWSPAAQGFNALEEGRTVPVQTT